MSDSVSTAKENVWLKKQKHHQPTDVRVDEMSKYP